MPSFRCSICFDNINDAAKPLATLCGHIYCLDCATFRFSTDPSCAVCREPQTLERLVRLYPDWEGEETRQDARVAHSDHNISSSPVSVYCMDNAAEGAVSAVKQAIADREDIEDALMVCNTFVNSVTDREKPHINTENLRELSFQLTLLSTKLKDNKDLLTKDTKNAASARALEARYKLKVKQQRASMELLEEKNAKLSSELCQMRDKFELLERQAALSIEDANRQHIRAGKLEAQVEDLQGEVESWKQHALKVKKKYLVLKDKIKAEKRAAAGASSRQVHDGSDDLLVMG